MSRALYCEHCREAWRSAAAHGMAEDRERCPRCGGPLTLDKPPAALQPRRRPSGRRERDQR